MTRRPLRLTASWAYPIDSPPFQDAAILIGADGHISRIGPAAEVPPSDGIESIDLPGAALLPGLVNTHTHLELTGLEGSAPEDRFREWILTIRRLKEARPLELFLEAARQGVRDCWAGGVTTIADTGDSGSVIQALAELGGSGVVYQEVFGPHPDQAAESLAGLRGRVEALGQFVGGRVRLGVSPHAPYTVSGSLYRQTAEFAEAAGLPLAVHVAESVEETEFVTRGQGPFADAWTSRGIPPLVAPGHAPARTSPGSPSPVEWLEAHGVLGPHTLCIHAIQLLAGDIRILADRGCAVAHCPLSNARHRHGSAPLADLRRAGIPVGLGTDSVASVGRLDLFGEMRAAQALGGLTDREALQLATLDGARALGLEDQIGSLAPGKWGDVIAVQHPIPGQSGGSNPASPAVLLTVVGGRVVHRT